MLDNTGERERQTIVDNTRRGGKRGRGKRGEGERQTMLDIARGGGKTNNVRQYRGREKDKHC